VRFGGIRVQLEHAVEAHKRFLEPAEYQQRGAAVVVGRSELRLQADRAINAGERRFTAPYLIQQTAQIIPG